MKNISTNILSLGAGIYTAGLFLFNNTDNMVLAGHFLFALVYLLDELGSDAFSHIDQDDLLFIKEAIMVTKKLLLKLK